MKNRCMPPVCSLYASILRTFLHEYFQKSVGKFGQFKYSSYLCIAKRKKPFSKWFKVP